MPWNISIYTISFNLQLFPDTSQLVDDVFFEQQPSNTSEVPCQTDKLLAARLFLPATQGTPSVDTVDSRQVLVIGVNINNFQMHMWFCKFIILIYLSFQTSCPILATHDSSSGTAKYRCWNETNMEQSNLLPLFYTFNFFVFCYFLMLIEIFLADDNLNNI